MARSMDLLTHLSAQNLSMETGCGSVLSELTRGRELALQARGGSAETCRLLLQEILSVLDRTIFMVTSGAAVENNHLQPTDGTESPRSVQAKSPREGQPRREMCKKRKMPAKWTSQARLGSGPGAEGPVEDGHNWRKYGQKEILGAKHPRGYYRCTHSKSQGCPAMKQMQRCEDDPLVFTVTYRGAHTCRGKQQRSRVVTPSAQNQDLLLSFRTGLKVKTGGSEDFKSLEEPTSSSLSFSFPSTPADSVKPEAVTFSPSSTLDNCFFGCEGFSSAFISPATSESNYFSMSPCQMSSYGGLESDFTETASAAATASRTDSTMLDMDLWLDTLDLDQEFPF